MDILTSNFHVEYPDMHRHWDSNSERYGGGDALLTRLQQGWKLSDTVWAEQYWHAGTRPVIVLHFRLLREGQQCDMPVISNPFVRRLIYKHKWAVRPLEARDITTSRVTEQK